jgi:predicted nuclease of predicted toxin-antitoxin system
VKLLFDENLSRKLVRRLPELYPGSAHVAEFDLLERPDREIWDFAQASGFIIVTTDADFYELAAAFGPPPKVIWLRAGHIRPGMLSLCSVATPYSSRNSPPIRPLAF